MNYKDKYIKYKSKYLQLVKYKYIFNGGASFESIKPKSVPTQDQGDFGTCWAHAYARSSVRTFQILCIIDDDKVEQWYELFYTILLQRKTCEEGGNFSNMVYLFDYLKDNIDNIFKITKKEIKCVDYKCSPAEKDVLILQFTEEQKEQIKYDLKFLFDNNLIFLAKYPYAVKPTDKNYPTLAIKEMLDLRLQPVLNILFSRSLEEFLSNKTTDTYDLFRNISNRTECRSIFGHSVVLRRWMNDRIEIKNSWGPNQNFSVKDLNKLICSENGDFLSSLVIDIECVMINVKEFNLPEYKDLKEKVTVKKERYTPTFDSTLALEIHNYRCKYDNYGFPDGDECRLLDYKSRVFFKGRLEHGLKNGKSIYRSLNGEVYEGDFKNDKRHGKGVEKMPNGEVYEGDFKNGKRHGKGKYIMPNGAVYEGDFKDDKIDGKCIHTESNGSVYEIEFKDGSIIKYKDYILTKDNINKFEFKPLNIENFKNEINKYEKNIMPYTIKL